MRERGEWQRLLVLVCLSVLFWIPQRHGPIDARWDGAIYYILGTSLSEGRGYRLLNEPGDIRAVQYPPLLPLVVAAHQRALGTSNFAVVGKWLRGFYFAVSLALSVAAYRLARQYLPPCRALLACAISALSLHVWYLSGVLYAEVPFALVAVLLATCARKAEAAGHWFATAALGVGAYLLRTAGIALLAAWAMAGLFDGRARAKERLKQAAVRGAVALLPIIAWEAYVSSVISSQEYLHPAYPYQRLAYQYSNVTYRENIALRHPFSPEEGRITTTRRIFRVLKNAAFITPSLGGAVTAQQGFWELTIGSINRAVQREILPGWAALIPMTALGLVILAGAMVMVKQGEWLVPLSCAGTAGVMCLTPWPEQFVRYFSPMIPFLSIMLVMALGAVIDANAGGASIRRRVAAGGLAVVVLTVVLLEDAYVTWWTFWSQDDREVTYYDANATATSGRLLFYGARASALDEALDYVRRSAMPGDVMATTVPHWAFLLTRVKAILPPMEADRDEARRLLDAVPVRFVVLDELEYPRISQRYAAPAIEGRPEEWRQVYRTAEGLASVYERVR